MGLVAIEPPSGNPTPLLVQHTFFCDVDANERRSIDSTHRYRDALSGEPEIVTAGVDNEPAVIADRLLVTRRPRIDEGHGEFDTTQHILRGRVTDSPVFLDARAK